MEIYWNSFHQTQKPNRRDLISSSSSSSFIFIQSVFDERNEYRKNNLWFYSVLVVAVFFFYFLLLFVFILKKKIWMHFNWFQKKLVCFDTIKSNENAEKRRWNTRIVCRKVKSWTMTIDDDNNEIIGIEYSMPWKSTTTCFFSSVPSVHTTCSFFRWTIFFNFFFFWIAIRAAAVDLKNANVQRHLSSLICSYNIRTCTQWLNKLSVTTYFFDIQS